MPGRPAVGIELSEAERAELASRLRRRKVARGDALRAGIVLLAADGAGNMAIAARLGITRVTVATWRNRFATERLAGLLDEPRPGAPRTVTDAKVAEVITAPLETLPAGRTHWSSRGMAKASGLAPSTVQRICKAFALQPHRVETFKRSTAPSGCCRCALDRPSGALTTTSGTARPRCSQHWTCSGSHHASAMGTRGRHRHRQVHAAPPGGRVPPLPRSRRGEAAGGSRAEGNARRAVHPRPRVPVALARREPDHGQRLQPQDQAHPRLVRPGRPHWHVHDTPTSASWIKQAERFFALLTELQIKRGAHRSTAELEAAITTSIDTHNANPKPFRCTKSADEPKATPERWYILAAIQRVCQRTLAVQAQCG
jgi:transposase